MRRKIRQLLIRAGIDVRRANPRRSSGIAASREANSPSKGRVLLSYVPDPFLVSDESQIAINHTHHWESYQIAQSFLAHGFGVDIIHYSDDQFVPTRDYDVLVSARTNLERLAGHLKPSCLKIAHLDTAHFLTNNTASYGRLLDTRSRRKVALPVRRIIEVNWAIEAADLGCVLGNDYTAETYAYAGKPIYRIPISTTAEFDWDEDKDFDQCRSGFLWFGSAGFVHKGLDLVLETFNALPDHQLAVCGPLQKEKPFCENYKSELSATNISAIGWVDVDGQHFQQTLSTSLGVVYPSCAEGGGGSVITCMHAGLIPIVTREASVDVGDFGIMLESASVKCITDGVRTLSSMPTDELRARSRAAWEYAKKHHTRSAFTKNYNAFVKDVVLPEFLRRKPDRSN